MQCAYCNDVVMVIPVIKEFGTCPHSDMDSLPVNDTIYLFYVTRTVGVARVVFFLRRRRALAPLFRTSAIPWESNYWHFGFRVAQIHGSLLCFFFLLYSPRQCFNGRDATSSCVFISCDLSRKRLHRFSVCAVIIFAFGTTSANRCIVAVCFLASSTRRLHNPSHNLVSTSCLCF